jgi:hypothetical protein
MADTNYIAHLTGKVRAIVISCYVGGLKHTYREFQEGCEGSCVILTVSSCFSRLLSACILHWVVHSPSSTVE